MSLIKIFATFTFYGVDVSLLALLTTIVTQLTKKTIFRNAQRKIITFIPFILGTVFYAIYAAIKNLSFVYILDEYVTVLEYGLSVGALSTLYYVLYEQFVRKDNKLTTAENVVATLLSGYIPQENIEKAAKEITAAISRDVTGNGATRTQEILTNYCDGQLSENDIHLLTSLVVETLAHLTTV